MSMLPFGSRRVIKQSIARDQSLGLVHLATANYTVDIKNEVDMQHGLHPSHQGRDSCQGAILACNGPRRPCLCSCDWT